MKRIYSVFYYIFFSFFVFSYNIESLLNTEIYRNIPDAWLPNSNFHFGELQCVCVCVRVFLSVCALVAIYSCLLQIIILKK